MRLTLGWNVEYIYPQIVVLDFENRKQYLLRYMGGWIEINIELWYEVENMRKYHK